MGYLSPKPSFKKILILKFGGIRGFIFFPKGISPKTNITARLEFDLAHFEAEVLLFSHYATENTLTIMSKK